MLPGQASVTSFFVQSKLNVRRLVRHWRALSRNASKPDGTRPGMLDPGGMLGEDTDASTRDAKARGARLPMRSPDRVPARAVAFCLFVLSLCVRCYKISEPPAVVFDELHFGKFVNSYWDKRFYFDIHPPLGKLSLYAASRMFASQRPASNFSRIGERFQMPEDAAYLPMRITSAVYGAAVPPTTFLIARELGFGRWAAVAPAFAQAVDSLLVIESRLILMDSQLAAFCALCFLCALRLWGARKRTRERLKYLVLTAVFGAHALSVKWTALATPALVAIVSLVGAPFPRQGRLEVAEMGLAGAIAAAIYIFYFYIHFSLLPNTGAGDAFMPNEFQRTLTGSTMFDAAAPKPSFLSSFWLLNKRMLLASAGIKTRHTWESKYYSWPISWRGVLYYIKEESFQRTSKVYLTANLVVAYAALASCVLFTAYVVTLYSPRMRVTKLSTVRGNDSAFVARGVYFLAGYVLNILPFVLVERCTFLYHYCPALFYAELVLANVLNALPLRLQRPVCGTFMLLALLYFIRWSPWTYGTPISHEGHERLALYGDSWH